VQHQLTPNSNLYMTWEESRWGRGGLMGDHWLGNQHLHDLLASRKMVLTVSYVIYNGTSFSRNYTNLMIKDEPDNFAIESFAETNGDLGGDCIGSLIGKGFSASDSDNDGLVWWPCAYEHRSSWWFDQCIVLPYSSPTDPPNLCNPNGRLTPTVHGLRTNTKTEVFWVDFPFSAYQTSIWLTDL